MIAVCIDALKGEPLFSQAIFGTFKTSSPVCGGNEVSANLTGIGHYHMIAYPTDIQIYFSTENANQISVIPGGAESLRYPDGNPVAREC
ncbi:MAG: hypothetical protein QG552_478 [Thermodesulfobacteriota bacterium]|nr:hypothetical protein [Thermodesulfobacteriota bacterium]